MACGLALSRGCPACGAPAEAEARFCSACGAPLESDAQSTVRGPVPSEERRRVTILFADIVGYTTVAERLDHESVKALTERYLSRLALEVERHGGYVDQYIGDNVMAVFGAPIAHEDDPERAVRAGWAMQQAMVELNRTAAADYGFELALRVGVNTGEVLAGRIGDEYTVVGDAVNVAARLQGAAPVGGVLVGRQTSRTTGKGIDYRSLGPLRLKGRAEPVDAWEVLSVDEQEGRRSAPVWRTQMVGRQAELARLVRLCDLVAHEDCPHLVTISGEAGIGKTRLVDELERRLRRRVPRTSSVRGRAVGFGAGPLYGPLAEMLRVECGILAGDDGPRIEQRLGPAGPLIEEPSEHLAAQRPAGALRAAARRTPLGPAGAGRGRARQAQRTRELLRGGSLAVRRSRGRPAAGRGLGGHAVGRRRDARADLAIWRSGPRAPCCRSA